ncbi:hypothetical protein [Kribbella sp. NPDC004536]|uniref:hypothetical protein n=1 Tax=Kribbella sp. NPDC004536 TaxID=3364106 RepID=UPI0036A0F9CD
MNKQEIDRLVAGADPFGDGPVPTPAAAADLVEEIMTTTAATPEVRRAHRRPILVAVAAAAAAIAVAVTGALIPHGNPAAPAPAYAAEARAFAENNARILLGPSWKVQAVNLPFTRSDGELTFSDGKHTVDVVWRPSDQYHDYYSTQAGTKEPVTVLGRKATLFLSTPDRVTMLPPDGASYVEIRAALGSDVAYRKMLADLRTADVDTWLAAMPASAVQPARRADVVAGIFQDIPVPNGFDRDAFAKGDVDSRYNLGAAITGHVTCAWLDQWTTGDAAAKKQAKDALATAHSWKILNEMVASGAWSKGLWEITDALVQQGRVEAEYKVALGC